MKPDSFRQACKASTPPPPPTTTTAGKLHQTNNFKVFPASGVEFLMKLSEKEVQHIKLSKVT
jgi:hypothetical protein